MPMRQTLRLVLRCAVGACVASSAAAQSNIDPANKYCWGENIGFVDWRDAGAPPGSQGVRIGATFLWGFAWGENVGWMNFGSGAPANGTAYANPVSGTVIGVPDFGVNRDLATGNLSGFAWAENTGWINFSGGAAATPPNPARFDAAAHRLRGFAWGENVGWINLDSATVLVKVCLADFNFSGEVTVQDIFDFLTAYFGGNLQADVNGSGTLSVQDIFDFLAAYFAGCS